IVDNDSPYSNMVYLNLSDDVPVNSQQIGEKMKRLGILLDAENPRRFRLVTHYEIDDEAIERTITGFREALN
ncbi:MAG: threonine aldolase, partial [Anaerolineales bacterium]